MGSVNNVHAQTSTGSSTTTSACLSVSTNLRTGTNSRDDVSILQRFLANQGYFNSAYIGGPFGPMTLKAVLKFQAANNLPTTGFVGPMTRAVITKSQKECQPVSTNAAVLYDLSPTSAPVGATVTLTGFGFTNSNTILFDGNLVARDVPITSSRAIACTTSPSCHGGINQTLTFTVPSALSPNCPVGSMCPLYMRMVTPGQYSVTVQNENGVSNTVIFTVTADSTSTPSLTINGLDAPSSLSIGQSGTWTVRASTANGAGTLHYSVDWNEEEPVTSSFMVPKYSTTQTSATFTHSYQRSGTYNLTFTVTDDAGASASVSNTLTIQPLY